MICQHCIIIYYHNKMIQSNKCWRLILLGVWRETMEVTGHCAKPAYHWWASNGEPRQGSGEPDEGAPRFSKASPWSTSYCNLENSATAVDCVQSVPKHCTKVKLRSWHSTNISVWNSHTAWKWWLWWKFGLDISLHFHIQIVLPKVILVEVWNSAVHRSRAE